MVRRWTKSPHKSGINVFEPVQNGQMATQNSVLSNLVEQLVQKFVTVWSQHLLFEGIRSFIVINDNFRFNFRRRASPFKVHTAYQKLQQISVKRTFQLTKFPIDKSSGLGIYVKTPIFIREHLLFSNASTKRIRQWKKSCYHQFLSHKGTYVHTDALLSTPLNPG